MLALRVVAFLVGSLACSPAAIAAPISFDLTDYAELGFIRTRISPVFQEIQIVNSNVSFLNLAKAGFDATKSSLENLRNSPPSIAASALALAADLNRIKNAVEPGTLDGIASGLSAIDLSSVRGALSQLSSDVSILSSQLGGELSPDSYFQQLNYAVAASLRARQSAQSLRGEVLTSYNSLSSSYQQVQTAKAALTELSNGLSSTINKAFELGIEVEAKMANPLFTAVLKPYLEALATTIADLTFLQLQAQAAQSSLSPVESKAELRLDELFKLGNLIGLALAQPPLPSEWIVFADISGADFRSYRIAYPGFSFTHPYTEIEGEFSIGSVSLTNLIGFIGTTTPRIDFTAIRYVNDPVFGLVETRATAPLRTTYITTPNTGDPRESADYFDVRELGIQLNIFEGSTEQFEIFARYDSPLRISRIRLAGDGSGGFITADVPEPNSFTLAATALIASALLLRGRKTFARKKGAAS